MARDLAVLADGGVLLDLDERANFGVIADGASIEIDEFCELDILAEANVRRDAREVVHHRVSLARSRGMFLRETPSFSISSYRVGLLIANSAAARVKFPLVLVSAASISWRSRASRALLSGWPSNAV